jgi:hypothetical protein
VSSKGREATFLFANILAELCNNLFTASEKISVIDQITFSLFVAYISVFIFYSWLISETIIILLFEMWSTSNKAKSHSCMKVYACTTSPFVPIVSSNTVSLIIIHLIVCLSKTMQRRCMSGGTDLVVTTSKWSVYIFTNPKPIYSH